MILFLLVLKVNVYAIENKIEEEANNNITTESEIEEKANNDITAESEIEEKANNNITAESEIEEKADNDITIENDIKKQDKKLVYSRIEKTKENGIYKIAVSQDINKSIEVPGGNEDNNIQLGIWDYR